MHHHLTCGERPYLLSRKEQDAIYDWHFTCVAFLVCGCIYLLCVKVFLEPCIWILSSFNKLTQRKRIGMNDIHIFPAVLSQQDSRGRVLTWRIKRKFPIWDIHEAKAEVSIKVPHVVGKKRKVRPYGKRKLSSRLFLPYFRPCLTLLINVTWAVGNMEMGGFRFSEHSKPTTLISWEGRNFHKSPQNLTAIWTRARQMQSRCILLSTPNRFSYLQSTAWATFTDNNDQEIHRLCIQKYFVR